MVAAKPTGASALTVTPAPVALVSAENSTEPVAKNDAFDEIKNKFLNEIDKIPCKFSLRDKARRFPSLHPHWLRTSIPYVIPTPNSLSESAVP